MSFEENNNEGKTSFYEFNPVSEVCNLSLDKLYDVIKMLSRSLCKFRNKNIDLKKVKINLENQLLDSCLKDNFENLMNENVKLRE